MRPTELPRIVLVDGRPGLELALSVSSASGPVEVAHTPAEAMELIDSLKPRVVVIDISMPGGGGSSLVAAIRRLHPRLPLLALSSEPSAAEARKAGADAFVPLSRAATELPALLKRIQEAGMAPPPIIVVTAYMGEPEVKAVQQDPNVRAVLPKPVNQQRLLSALHEALHTKQPNRKPEGGEPEKK